MNLRLLQVDGSIHSENDADLHVSATTCQGRYYLVCPGAGTRQSCCMKPMLSAWCQSSTNFPPAKREMVMPVTVTCLPVAGICIGVTISPVLVPRNVQRVTTWSPSAITSSILRCRSGKALRLSVTHCL